MSEVSVSIGCSGSECSGRKQPKPGPIQAAQVQQASHDRDVVQRATAVLAAFIGSLYLRMYRRRPATIPEYRGNPDLEFIRLYRLPDGVLNLPSVAAEGFRVPVDHNLRRVDSVQVKAPAVTFLTAAENRQGERVPPSEMVPVGPV